MDIITELGGPTAVARLLGLRPPSVSRWRNTGIPIERALEIERATRGKWKRWHLRPDDWHVIWPELRKVDGAPKVRRKRQL